MLDLDSKSFSKIGLSDNGQYLFAGTFENELCCWDVENDFAYIGCLQMREMLTSLEVMTAVRKDKESGEKVRSTVVIGGGESGRMYTYTIDFDDLENSVLSKELKKNKNSILTIK